MTTHTVPGLLLALLLPAAWVGCTCSAESDVQPVEESSISAPVLDEPKVGKGRPAPSAPSSAVANRPPHHLCNEFDPVEFEFDEWNPSPHQTAFPEHWTYSITRLGNSGRGCPPNRVEVTVQGPGPSSPRAPMGTGPINMTLFATLEPTTEADTLAIVLRSTEPSESTAVYDAKPGDTMGHLVFADGLVTTLKFGPGMTSVTGITDLKSNVHEAMARYERAVGRQAWADAVLHLDQLSQRMIRERLERLRPPDLEHIRAAATLHPHRNRRLTPLLEERR